MPYNPIQQRKLNATEIRKDVTAISLNVSGILAVTTKHRKVRDARVDYNGVGGSGSGQASVSVVGVSGGAVDIAFNVPTSGTIGYIYLAGSGSGIMYSGGTLRVFTRGD